MMISINCKTAPQMLPVVNQPEMIGGVVQGNITPLVYGTKWNVKAIPDNKTLTKGVITKGIAMIGFKTTGNP